MMLGTTQFVNATVQLWGLARVAVVRCRWRRHAVLAAPALLADLACQPGRARRLRPFCCCTLARAARKLLLDCAAAAGCWWRCRCMTHAPDGVPLRRPRRRLLRPLSVPQVAPR